jgi:putative FmdB family regulatory protein
MAIYEYLCQPCQTPFTMVRPMDRRDEPAECPLCFSTSQERTMPTFFTRISESSRPRSFAEQLAGKGVMKPKGDGTTGILGHKCHPGCGC